MRFPSPHKPFGRFHGDSPAWANFRTIDVFPGQAGPAELLLLFAGRSFSVPQWHLGERVGDAGSTDGPTWHGWMPQGRSTDTSVTGLCGHAARKV